MNLQIYFIEYEDTYFKERPIELGNKYVLVTKSSNHGWHFFSLVLKFWKSSSWLKVIIKLAQVNFLIKLNTLNLSKLNLFN